MRGRDLLAAAGIGAAAFGLVLVARPSLAAAVSVPRLAVILLGLLALVEGIRAVQRRRGAERDAATPPDPEERPATPVPGDGFDERLGALGAGGVGGDYDRLRRRLRSAAVAAVAARSGRDGEEAEDAVAAGAWTDDPVAAWFLGGPEVPEPPRGERLRIRFGSTPQFRVYARRTADAVAGVWEGG